MVLQLITSSNILITGDQIVRGKNAKFFGGFCECGSEYEIVLIFNCPDSTYLLRRCNCGTVDSLEYRQNGKILKREVVLLSGLKAIQALKKIFTQSEFEALLSKFRGERYSYSAFSRAKKRLESFGLSLSDLEPVFRES